MTSQFQLSKPFSTGNMTTFFCKFCERSYATKTTLARHEKTNKHLKNVAEKENKNIELPKITRPRKDIELTHTKIESTSDKVIPYVRDLVNGTHREIKFNVKDKKADLEQIWNFIKNEVNMKYLQDFSFQNARLKVDITMVYRKGDEVITNVSHFPGDIILKNVKGFDNLKLMKDVNDFLDSDELHHGLIGSGFSLVGLENFIVKLVGFNEIGGKGHVLMKDVKLSGVISIDNSKELTDKCFELCCMYHFNKGTKELKKDPQRITKYFKNGYIYPRIEAVENKEFVIHDYQEYESIDKDLGVTRLHIFEYSHEDKVCTKFYTSSKIIDSEIDAEKLVEQNLIILYVPPLDVDDEYGHYCYVKDVNKLIRTQTSKHDQKRHVCPVCVKHFSNTAKGMLDHMQNCLNIVNNNQNLDVEYNVMKDKNIKFKKFSAFEKKRFSMYCDFESVQIPEKGSSFEDSEGNTVHPVKTHKAYSFCIVTMDNGKFCPKYSTKYRGKSEKETMYNFFQFLKKVKYGEYCEDGQEKTDYGMLGDLNKDYPIDMTDFSQELFDNAKECYMCGVETDDLVRSHCHYKEKDNYEGAACQKCNKSKRKPKSVDFFMHNGIKYDSHLIINAIAQYDFDIDISSVIPNNSQSLMTYTLMKFFDMKDSFKFQAASLDNLSKSIQDYSIVPKVYKFFGKKVDSKMLKDLKRKAHFPHEYLDNYKKLNDKELPEKKHFYSSLTKSDISNKRYKHSCRMFKNFECSDLGEYSDMYLILDVILLAQIMEEFRASFIEHTKIDPIWYITLQSACWDAMLCMSDIKLGKIDDHRKYCDMMNGIRGGLTQVCQRYCLNTDEVDLLYIDANSLYPTVMSKKLPVNLHDYLDLDGMNEEEKIGIIKSYSMEGDQGCFTCVDVEYPEDLHENHKDLPFLPDRKTVTYNELSEAAREAHIANCVYKLKREPQKYEKFEKLSDLEKELKYETMYASGEKLMATLEDKKEYICHFSLIQQAMKYGLIIKKVHWILPFDQEAFMKEYIDTCVTKRKNATTTSQKDIMKLFMNSIFGKTMENIEKRYDGTLCNSLTTKQLMNLNREIASPYYKDSIILHDNLVFIQRKKKSVTMSKPTYIGAAILDLSKVFMYEYYYGTVKSIYGKDVNLVYMDTDSFILKMSNGRKKEELMIKDIKNFDMSDYPSKHSIWKRVSPEDKIISTKHNKKKLGCFKDELKGLRMLKFIGLKPKMYAYTVSKSYKNCIKAKGVPNNIAKTMIYEDYEHTLRTNELKYLKFHKFVTQKHEIKTVELEKIALNSFDNKRMMLTDSFETTPYGFKG